MSESIPRRLRPRRFWLPQPWRVRFQKFPGSSVPRPLSLFVLHLRSDPAPNPVSIPKGPRSSIFIVIGLAPEPIIGGIMHLFYKSWLAAAIVVAVVLSVGTANAQSGGTSSGISGTVLDPSGAVVANATVEIHNAVSGFDRTTTQTVTGSSVSRTCRLIRIT